MRKIVKTQPEIVFKASNEPCEVKVCVPSTKRDGSENPLVLIHVGFAEETPKPTKVGDPMPFNSQYSVFVEAHQVVWAFSAGEALMTVAVFPWGR